MAAHLLVLYNAPADPGAFDRYYVSTHVPIAKKIPGLKRYTISRDVTLADGSTAPYHLVADLEFESLDALGKALGSPEGAAAAGDVPNFATGGVTMVSYESIDV